MIEFRILIKDEDRLQHYIRTLSKSNFLSSHVIFEDVDKEWETGTFDRGLTYVAKMRENAYLQSRFYTNMLSMFRDLKSLFNMDVHFRYVKGLKEVYTDLYDTPFCKIIEHNEKYISNIG